MRTRPRPSNETPRSKARSQLRRRFGAFISAFGLLASLMLIFTGTASADAGNPILGTIHATSEFNADGSVTVYVRGQWNWYSHNSDCNFNRAATGVGIIWNDPTETGYTVSKGGISAQIGIASKNGSWNDPNPLDPMVHPVDVGHIPAGYPGAAGQQFNDPASNNPNDVASWRGGCGREPLTATANPNGPTCGDGTLNCDGKPWGSWGYSKNGGKGYSHVFRSLADISRVCANFYDVHGGGKAGSNNFQVANGAKEITVDQNGDNSIETNAFNVNEGANCITVAPPDLVVKKVVDKAQASPGDTLTYTITVQNQVNVDITNVDITDDISPIVPGFGSLTGSTPSATVGGANQNQLSWSNQTIPASSTQTYKYFVKLKDTGWPAGQTSLPNVVVVTKSNCVQGSNDPNCRTVTIVQPNPDLQVVKTADNPTVAAGNQIGFTITVNNTGSTTLTNVQLNDPLPVIAGLGIAWSVASSSPANSCQVNNNTLTCGFGSLAAGASASVHVTSPTTAPAGGGANPLPSCTIQVKNHTANLDNTATVTTGNITRTDRDGICVTNPGLTVTKTADATTVSAGSQVGFTITAQNTGNTTLSAVTLTDPLPTIAGLGMNWSVASSTPANSCGINANNNQLTCTFGDLAPGATASVHVTSPTTAPAGGGANPLPNCTIQVKGHTANLDNTATVTTGNTTKTDRDGICVTNPGLSVVKTADNVLVQAGNPIGFTITATNTGNTTLSAVTLSDPLPTTPGAGISWSVATSSPAGACQINGINLTCTFGDLAPGASASVHVTSPTTAPAGGGANPLPNCTIQVKGHTANLDNTATVTTGNTTRTDRDGICLTNPGLTVVKTADNATVTAGNQIGFTITATNNGNTTLSNVQLSDPLPTIAGLGISWSVASSSPAGACQILGNNLTCNFGDLAPGASASVHVTSPTTAPAGGGANPLPNCQIQVKGHTANLDNTATVTTTSITRTDRDGICIQSPDITIVKTADSTTVSAGSQIGFTINVTNSGNTTLNSVTVTDPLPTIAGLGIAWSVASSNPAGVCNIAGNSLTCNFGTMAPGVTASVHVTSPTTAPAGGGANPLPNCTIQVKGHTANLDNTATVTTGNTTRTDRDGICVTNPGLTVTKSADNASVNAGSQIGFTITASNTGNTTLPAVTLTDPLPTIAGLGINWTVASSSPAGACNVAANNLTCNFGDLAPGASASVHVVSPTTAPGGGGANPLPNCLIQVKGHTANLDNTATVTTGNTTRTDRDGICVQNPNLTIVKTADAPTVVVGSQIGFTINVTNTGNTTLTAVTLNDPLPTIAGIGIAWSVASSSPANTCSIAGNNLACNFGDLVAGATASVHVTSPTTAPAAGANPIPACTIQVKNHNANLNNTATVTTGGTSKSDTDGICVTSTPHLTVTKVPDAQSVLAGNPVGFTIVVKSDGNGTVQGVTLNDALPTLANAGINWSISPAYGGPGTCTIGGAPPSQTLACNIGDMAAGTQASVHVTSPTTAPPGNTTLTACTISVVTFATNLNNAVQVTSQTGIGATAQTGTCVTINQNPAIHIVKTANPTQLPVGGGPVTYTYAVTNAGNVPLSNVTVVDNKCSPVVFLSGDTNNDAKLDLTETWRYSCTKTITVTTTNTAVATGHWIDPNDPAKTDHTVTDQDQATVIVPVPTPTPTGSVKGATSPPKPHVSLPPTDSSDPLGSTGQDGMVMILILLAGIVAAVPVLLFGKRRQVRR